MPTMGDAQRVGQGGLSKLTDGPRTTSDLSKVGSGLTRGPNQGKKLAAAAWSETWPSPGSTLDLDFANDRGWVRGVGQGKSMDAVMFTRASNGNYVKPDGTLSSHANQGALGNNLLTFPQDFDNAVWGKAAVTITPKAEIAPDGTLTANAVFETAVLTNKIIVSADITLPASATVTVSVYAKTNGRILQINFGNSDVSGDPYVNFDLNDGSYVSSGSVTADMIDVGNGWYRCIATVLSAVTTNFNVVYGVVRTTSDGRRQTYSGNVDLGIFIWGAQLELGSTATEYFPTNIGLQRRDWASTASTGAGTQADPRIIPLAANAECNGFLVEESRANRILWCRDATQANWTKTNVTAVKDQTGIDGVANAASSLTATANDGTCVQTITLASGSRTGSVYLKRITGTGNVQVSLDGSTYSTVDLSASEWRRIVISGTVTNPTVGIKLAVSGDAVAMDYGQVEDGAFVTSPILTTTASVTRAVDLAEIAGSNFSFFTQQEETSVIEFLGQGATAGLLLNSANIGNLQILNTGIARHANGISNLDTAANYTAGNFGKAAVSGNRAKRVVALNGITSVVNPQPVRSTTTVANVRIGGTAVTIKRATMLPEAVTESALEAITK